MKRIVQCLSHAIESYDQLRLLTSLGYEVFDIGPYIEPAKPHVPIRPALPGVTFYPELKAAVDALGTDDNLAAAQSNIPLAILDWLGDDGVIIFHHYLERLYSQWPRIFRWKQGSSGRRVIWRSVGQSVTNNEVIARPYREAGLERVAYSPKEANIPGYSGHDALIRFYKIPAEWTGWTGDWRGVINFTQHLRQRDPFTNWRFWDEVTRGLALPISDDEDDEPSPPYRLPLGPGSEAIGGPGEQTYEQMRDWLRRARVYLYTGTQPASYTLGLIEAGMTGTPIVSIGAEHMQVFPYGPELFEGHELTDMAFNDPAGARSAIDALIRNRGFAESVSRLQRERFVRLFGKDTIGAQWKAFLG